MKISCLHLFCNIKELLNTPQHCHIWNLLLCQLALYQRNVMFVYQLLKIKYINPFFYTLFGFPGIPGGFCFDPWYSFDQQNITLFCWIDQLKLNDNDFKQVCAKGSKLFLYSLIICLPNLTSLKLNQNKYFLYHTYIKTRV